MKPNKTNDSDCDRALTEILRLVKTDITTSAYKRWKMNDKGIKLTLDQVDALNEFHKKAKGDDEAQLLLGVFYAVGEGGCKQDYCRAYILFSLAADRGREDASKALKNLKICMTDEQIKKAECMVKEWREQNDNGEES